MTPAILSSVAPDSEIEIRDWRTVFTYCATKGERVVLELIGLQNPASPQVRVLAYVGNAKTEKEQPPQKSLLTFPSSEHAARFAEEAILCVEYLGCTITNKLNE